MFALACEASVCRLLRGDAQRGSDAGASELVDVPGSQLPEGIEARGLAFDSALDALCVFGNALACFGDAWTTPIAPTSGLEILEVSGQLGEVTMIALGAQGRWWKRVASASGGLMVWAEQPALEQTVLTGAAVADERAVLFGPEQWWLVADRALTSCSPSQGTMGVFLRAGTPFTEFVTSDGRVVAYRLEEPLGRGSWRWCTTQQLELGGEPAIGRASAACRASLNSRLLTASRLVGTTLCVVLN